MNAFRSGVVGMALAGLVGFLITKYEAIVTNEGLMWAAIAVGVALVSLVFSWGFTQFYKQAWLGVDLDVTPATEDGKKVQDAARRRVYICAVLSCLAPVIVLGILLKLASINHMQMVVFATVWVIGGFALSLASPFLWKLVFELLVPWMMEQEKKP